MNSISLFFTVYSLCHVRKTEIESELKFYSNVAQHQLHVHASRILKRTVYVNKGFHVSVRNFNEMMPWMKLRYNICNASILLFVKVPVVMSGLEPSVQTKRFCWMVSQSSYPILFWKYHSWFYPYHLFACQCFKSPASEHCRSFTRGPVLHSVAMDDVTAHRGSGAFGAESDRYKLILCH